MKDACIIGAGSSGLPTAKALLDRGLSFDWFELGSALGGNWRYDNDNGRSAAYDSLHIDTSKERMAYADLPMPRSWPTYLPHRLVLTYFERYAEEFGLEPHLTTRTEVMAVRPADDGWTVTTRRVDDGETTTRQYRTVFVCSGHHWSPHLPTWPGTFTGELFHSREYRSPRRFEGRRVLVVGIGNSGTDIAVDATATASRVAISTRRGAHVIPRFVLGRPTDQWTSPATAGLPLPLVRTGYRLLLWLSRGRQRPAEIPIPANPILGEHPTMSQELPALVRAGRVTIEPDVVGFDGRTVHFADGRAEEFDVVVAATGYDIRFPFLADGLVPVTDNRIDLYRRVVHPDLPGLFFIGLVQPLGAIMPLAEAQAQWAARIAAGAPLPTREEMRAEIVAYRAGLEGRYVPSRRHTIQVDYWPYLLEMRREVEAAERSLAVP